MRNRKRLVILLLLLLSFSCSSLAKPTEVIYLIPENFTGGVIIVYNQPDGITPETTKDGTVIYHIPKDGLIRVKEPLTNDSYTFKYYFVDDKGSKTPIEYLYPGHYVRDLGDTTSKSFDTISEEETNNKVFAMIHTTTNFSIQGKKVYIYNFIVGKPKDYQILYLRTSDKIDEIQIGISKVKAVKQ